jgi:hypothetical protein
MRAESHVRTRGDVAIRSPNPQIAALDGPEGSTGQVVGLSPAPEARTMSANHPPGGCARVGRTTGGRSEGFMGYDTEADGVRTIREIRHGIAP